MMLVLAVVGIIVVSSGSTLKAREGGDGRGSSSAGSRTLAPLVRCFFVHAAGANTRHD